MTPRGVRNKNPGNIEKGPAWLGLAEDQSSDNRFAVFEAPQFGIRALCKVLLTYHHKRLAADGSAIDTVGEVIDRWAPPVENDTDAYANMVRKALGVERGEEIDIDDPEVLLKLAAAIIRHENGQQPYDEATLRAGVDMALALPVRPKPRKLAFGFKGHTVAIEPEPLDLWKPQGREEPVRVYVLPVKSFIKVAVKFGHPPDIGAFAIWGGWWVKDTMYFRCDRYAELAVHEWRHIETQSNFHAGGEHEH